MGDVISVGGGFCCHERIQRERLYKADTCKPGARPRLTSRMASSTSDADTAHKLDVLRRAYRVLKADSEAREQALAEERAAHAATLSEKLALSTKLEAAERELIAANEEVWSASPSPRISTSLSLQPLCQQLGLVPSIRETLAMFPSTVCRSLLRGSRRRDRETEPRRQCGGRTACASRGGTARPLWHEPRAAISRRETCCSVSM